MNVNVWDVVGDIQKLIRSGETVDAEATGRPRDATDRMTSPSGQTGRWVISRQITS